MVICSKTCHLQKGALTTLPISIYEVKLEQNDTSTGWVFDPEHSHSGSDDWNDLVMQRLGALLVFSMGNIKYILVYLGCEIVHCHLILENPIGMEQDNTEDNTGNN